MDSKRNEPEPAAVHASDDYERKYMDAEGSLARARKAMPWWFHSLLGVAALVSVGSSIASHQFVGLATLPLLAFVWLLFSFLRVAVTARHVHVQLGLFGPKIPIEQIVSARAASYDPIAYGGWGIRYSLAKGWAYSVPGGTGRGVEIEYSPPGKSVKHVFVSAENADEIVSAIARARSGVRVDVGRAQENAEVEVDAAASDERKRSG